MSELLTIEGVNNKPKFPKFSNGSVLAGGVWYSVSKDLPISLFQRDTQMNVEVKTNDKGYKSIVAATPSTAVTTTEYTPKRTYTKKTETKETNGSYEDNKNRRIQVQGILQAAAQSPATINFGDDVSVIAEKVLVLTDLLIAGMDARV